MITLLLILHGLLAMALVGAVTHQALAACWPVRRAASTGVASAGIVEKFRAVSGPTYTNTVIVLFVVTFVLGSVIYPSYRLGVRNYLQSFRLLGPEGAFEVKEHFVSIGLGLLPVYWLLWRAPPDGWDAGHWKQVRKIVTAVLAVVVWLSFLVGHVLNNIRGLYGV